MSDYDYKEEALKLRKKRNLILNPIYKKIYNDYPPTIYQLEKKLSDDCKNLEEYKKRINKVLDKVEQDEMLDVKDPHNLFETYYTYLSIEAKAVCDYIYFNPPSEIEEV